MQQDKKRSVIARKNMLVPYRLKRSLDAEEAQQQQEEEANAIELSTHGAIEENVSENDDIRSRQATRNSSTTRQSQGPSSRWSPRPDPERAKASTRVTKRQRRAAAAEQSEGFEERRLELLERLIDVVLELRPAQASAPTPLHNEILALRQDLQSLKDQVQTLTDLVTAQRQRLLLPSLLGLAPNRIPVLPSFPTGLSVKQ